VAWRPAPPKRHAARNLQKAALVHTPNDENGSIWRFAEDQGP
jgi:hypothetical protein